MRPRPELRQLLIGISTSRYFPASGTAGLARSLVSGNSRVPAPPPMIIDSTRLVFGDIRAVPGVEAIWALPRETDFVDCLRGQCSVFPGTAAGVSGPPRGQGAAGHAQRSCAGWGASIVKAISHLSVHFSRVVE